MLMNVPLDDQTKDALVEAAPINHDGILKMFYGAVDEIRAVGHSIHIFIDDLDQFLISSQAMRNCAGWIIVLRCMSLLVRIL